MPRQIPKVLLLVALLAAFAASSAPAFGKSCGCYMFKDYRIFRVPGGCRFDQTAKQCVSTSCTGSCL